MNAAPGSIVLAALTASPPAGPQEGGDLPAGDSGFAAALAAAVTLPATAPVAPDEAGIGMDQELPPDIPSAAALALLATWLQGVQASPAGAGTGPADPSAGASSAPVEAEVLPGTDAAGLTGGSAAPIASLAAAAGKAISAVPPSPGSATDELQPEQAGQSLAQALHRAGSAPDSTDGARARSDLQPLAEPLRQMMRSFGGGEDRVEPSARGNVDPAAALALGALREPQAPASPTHALPEPVRSAPGTPRWSEEVGSRVMLMALRGQQEGSLTLTPEHLGPVEVRISVSQDAASVWFGAANADTRAALADALPRLREMFSAAGLSLGQAGVSQEAPRQDARAARPAEASLDAAARLDNEVSEALPAARILRARLLDAWA